MNGKQFVDTNILVYVHDLSAGAKCFRAQEVVGDLWQARSAVISTQVLQELYFALRRRLRVPMSVVEAQEALRDYFEWDLVINNRQSIIRAAELEKRFKISFWDALILQAAENSGASVLYSEDLNHGRLYGSVRVVNPFV